MCEATYCDPVFGFALQGLIQIYTFVIPLLRHFTIFGQENAQNMRR